MSLDVRWPTHSALPNHAPRQVSVTAALRQAARAAVAAVKRIYPAVLVLGTFGALFAAILALRVLIWLPLFPVNH
jgi:hypothetical protein